LRRKYGFGPARKFPAGQHHPMSAGAAFQANIRTQTGNIPFMPAAGMGFAHSHDVVQLQIRKHGFADLRPGWVETGS
jgi:hypothetical protein